MASFCRNSHVKKLTFVNATRILVHYLYSRIFTASFTCKLLDSVQDSLFPGGFPAASVPNPTPQEQVAVKDRALQAIASSLPSKSVWVACLV